MSPLPTLFRIIACILACVLGLAHLLLAVVMASPISFHVREAPPGLREHLTVAAIAALGVLLLLGCALTISRRRRGLFLLAGVGAVDAVSLLWTVVRHLSRGQLSTSDLMALVPALLTATALAAAFTGERPKLLT